tara:strand:+ start:2347 stop:2526 length:180 start_codon:yes stop_codon:yes gene_type:complete
MKNKFREFKEFCEKTKQQNLNFLESTKPYHQENYNYYEGKVDLITEILKFMEEKDDNII